MIIKKKSSLENTLSTECPLREKIAGYISGVFTKAITKISSCRVITTSRWGIKQAVIFFASVFLLFSSIEVAGDNVHSSREKSPAPALINDTPVCQSSIKIDH